MSNKNPELIQVPSEKEFAIRLAESFIQEAGMAVDTQDDESVLDVVLSIPEVHVEFTAWLCGIIHENTFDDVKSHGMLN